jgi:hypothetical protein
LNPRPGEAKGERFPRPNHLAFISALRIFHLTTFLENKKKSKEKKSKEE